MRLRSSFTRLAPDKRIQLIFVAFCFGAFFEGIAGFGAPVAVSSALLIQLGFAPLEACVLSLIANTAPVAFGSLGIPVTTLAKVTGLDVQVLAKIVGRQLTPFCFIVPLLDHASPRRLAGTARGVAGDGDSWREFWIGPAVHVELARAHARGHRRRPLLHGLRGAAAHGVEAQGYRGARRGSHRQGPRS